MSECSKSNKNAFSNKRKLRTSPCVLCSKPFSIKWTFTICWCKAFFSGFKQDTIWPKNNCSCLCRWVLKVFAEISTTAVLPFVRFYYAAASFMLKLDKGPKSWCTFLQSTFFKPWEPLVSRPLGLAPEAIITALHCQPTSYFRDLIQYNGSRSKPLTELNLICF